MASRKLPESSSIRWSYRNPYHDTTFSPFLLIATQPIAAQLIGDDLARHWARAQHSLEKTFCSSLVAPLLQQNVEFDAVLIDRTPNQIRFAAQCDENTIKMLRAARLASRCFCLASKNSAELTAPESDRLVRHDHAAFEEQFLDAAQAQLKAKIPAHSATDDHSRKTVAAIK